MRIKPAETGNVIVRNIVINGIHIHLKSVFTEQRKLDDALKDIVTSRLAEEKKGSHKACS
jgi:hypothetical protein